MTVVLPLMLPQNWGLGGSYPPVSRGRGSERRSPRSGGHWRRSAFGGLTRRGPRQPCAGRPGASGRPPRRVQIPAFIEGTADGVPAVRLGCSRYSPSTSTRRVSGPTVYASSTGSPISCWKSGHGTSPPRRFPHGLQPGGQGRHVECPRGAAPGKGGFGVRHPLQRRFGQMKTVHPQHDQRAVPASALTSAASRRARVLFPDPGKPARAISERGAPELSRDSKMPHRVVQKRRRFFRSFCHLILLQAHVPVESCPRWCSRAASWRTTAATEAGSCWAGRT